MIAESELLSNQTALSVGTAVVIAHKQADTVGYDFREQRISISQRISETGEPLWRVEFSPVPPPGVFRRGGGGYMVEVNAADGSVRRALFTQ